MLVSPKTPEIRALHLTDATWLEAFHAQCFDCFQRWSLDLFQNILIGTHVFGIALLFDGNPIGFTLCRAVIDECEILTCAIAPAMQGQGYGHQLIKALQKACTEKSIARIFLEVEVTNAAAINLYQKNDFVIVGHRPRYYQKMINDAPDWVDAHVMAKTILSN